MIEWTDDLDVGDDFVNSQHKTLIKKLNNFLISVKIGNAQKEILKTLKFLEEYTIKHFTDEENYMKKIKYPNYGDHKEKHIFLKNELKNLNEKVEKESKSLSFIINFSSFFTNWLLAHIKKEDKKIGEFLKEKNNF